MKNSIKTRLLLLVLLQPVSASTASAACCFMALDGKIQEERRVCRATLEEAKDASMYGLTKNDLHSRCRNINRFGFGRHCTVECFE